MKHTSGQVADTRMTNLQKYFYLKVFLFIGQAANTLWKRAEFSSFKDTTLAEQPLPNHFVQPVIVSWRVREKARVIEVDTN